MPIRFASSMILLVTVLTGCGDLDHGGTGPADPPAPEAPTATGAQQADAGVPPPLDAALTHDSSSPATDTGAPSAQDASPLPPPQPPDPGEGKQRGPKMH